MPGRLEGKAALITGATSGIGRAAALRFAREGAAVSIVGIDPEGGARVVGAIEGAGGRAIYVDANVEHLDQIERSVRETLDRLGKVDVFFSNAGIGTIFVGGTVETIEEERWHRALEINLTASYRYCKLLVPEMRRVGGGSIIFTSSSSALHGTLLRPTHAYAASKGGLLSLMRALAVSYAPDNIRCNAICPGFVETYLTHDLIATAEQREERRRAIPLGRLGQPEDIANVALFLGSDESSYMTGQALIVDGGADAR
jgi:meso-butanediol dehydrogenase/(S,S)-butanediol dehydrogenase/diacetyl reductase